MDLIIAITALMVSLTTNLYFIRKFPSAIQIEIKIPEPSVQVEVVREESNVSETTKTPKVVPDSSSYAWNNRKGIPMNETKYVPSPGRKPPPSGPMERPAGFSR